MKVSLSISNVVQLRRSTRKLLWSENSSFKKLNSFQASSCLITVMLEEPQKYAKCLRTTSHLPKLNLDTPTNCNGHDLFVLNVSCDPYSSS